MTHNKNSKITIMMDMPVNTDKTITANRPDIIIKGSVNSTCKLIDMSIPSDRNTALKEIEKKKSKRKRSDRPLQAVYQRCVWGSVIVKKRNWSAPGPNRIVNYWWKRAETLHESAALSFREIGLGDNDIPLWFTQGKTSLIPKPGVFSSDNTRPITCLNTIYKGYTSCLLGPTHEHLKKEVRSNARGST